MSRDTIKLGAFLMGVGHHMGAARAPDTDPRQILQFAHYKRLAQTAEAGGFDAIFFADNVALPDAPLAALSRSLPPYAFDPLSLLGALAPVTERIGLIATVSSTYMPPYHLARKLATLDHLSGGRIGWNLVTSGSDAEARNFGLDHQLGHAERYRRADEHVGVVKALWDSWDDDAVRADREGLSGFDPTKVRPIDHVGDYFAVRGPLQTPRGPQGHPVIVQAGASEDGRAFAARHAEVIFTAQQDLGEAKAFASDIRRRAVAAGRDAGDVLVMPGIMPFVAATRAEAQAAHDALGDLVDPRQGLGLLSAFLGLDASGFDLDGPLPALPPTEGWQSRQQLFVDLARREGLSVRQLVARIVSARGHKVLIGTPAEIVDVLETWFREGAADGFNILPPTLPAGLDAFVDQIVPELRRRGLLATAPVPATLRQRLGLKRPVAQPAFIPA